LKLTIVLALVVSLSSCAFSAVKRPDLANTKSPLVSSYNLSTSEATNNASNTLTIMGYTPIKDSDGSIVTNLVPTPIPANCDCGTWNGTVVTGTADSQFRVSFSGGSATKMNLRFSCIATFTATNIYGVPTRSEKYECASKGVLEQKFLDKFNEYAPDEDIFIKLEKLAQMRDNGILTDKEFNAEKKKLLGNP